MCFLLCMWSYRLGNVISNFVYLWIFFYGRVLLLLSIFQDLDTDHETWDELKMVRELNRFRREENLTRGISFPTIVAFGPHSAIPHYVPSNLTNVQVDKSNMLLIDSGGHYYGKLWILMEVGFPLMVSNNANVLHMTTFLGGKGDSMQNHTQFTHEFDFSSPFRWAYKMEPYFTKNPRSRCYDISAEYSTSNFLTKCDKHFLPEKRTSLHTEKNLPVNNFLI